MKKPNKITRREFLKGTATAGAALLVSCTTPNGPIADLVTASFAPPPRKLYGANEIVNVAVIGCGGKGGGHIKHFDNLKGVKVIAVSDPDMERMENKTKKLKHNVAKHQDFRKILEMKDVDAVIIATPNHWHAPAAILACQAGKDVYVEKPVAHGIWEGRQMVKAARKYNRIIQAGTQQRSDPYYQELKDDLNSGKYGKIKMVHCLKYRTRNSIKKATQPLQMPDSVDYNLWCGPAPMGPVMREKLHYDWHWQWNWGNGEMGNWGPHAVDDLRNILDWDDVPDRVVGAGGRFIWDDDGETPNMHIALFEHKGFRVVVDIRDLPAKKGVKYSSKYMKSTGHNVIICEGGTIRAGRRGAESKDNSGKRIKKYNGDGGGGHAQNFIDAVRSGKRSDLNCDIEVGHQSTMMCLMANIAYRVGKQASIDQVKAAMKDHQDALDTIKSTVTQINANEGDLGAMMLGPQLTFDPKKERFTGADAAEANKLLRYEMRKEFAIPEKI